MYPENYRISTFSNGLLNSALYYVLTGIRRRVEDVCEGIPPGNKHNSGPLASACAVACNLQVSLFLVFI